MSAIIGGSAFGRGDALIDTTDAVLLDGTAVAVIGAMRQDGVETVVALELSGRVNHSADRSEVLYLLNREGAADIISQLIGVAQRADPKFLDELLDAIGRLP